MKKKTNKSKEIHIQNRSSELKISFKTYAEAMPQMAFIADAEGKIIYFNQQWYKYVAGIEGTEGWGWKDQPIHHPDDLQKTIDRWNYSLKTGEPYEIEYRLRRHDGKYRWHLGRAKPVRDNKGNIEFWLGTNTDIHKQKEAEEELWKSRDKLKQNEQRYRLALKHSPVVFARVDVNLRYEWIFNPHKDFDPDLIIGKRDDELASNPGVKAMVNLKQRVLDKGRQEREEIIFDVSDGPLIYDITATPLFDENKQVIGLITASIDVTEQKNTEKALQEAKEEAEKAAHAKQDFLAHMSHEIRTPLNAIVGLTHLLLEQNPKKDQLDNLTTLKYSAENLRVLINDILDFSKIQAGKTSVNESEIELTSFLKRLYKTHQTLAEEKGIHLQLNIDNKIPRVIISDELKISQVLNNLLSNAIKFTHEGSVKLEVKLNKIENDHILLDFSVSDTGIGIPKHQLEIIFDIFNQADISTTREYGGTGLGLSLCKLYLEMMNSQIRVVSVVNKGSHFFFTLPVRTGTGKSLIKDRQLDRKARYTDLSHIKLLLIEDADVNRIMMKQFIENWWSLQYHEAVNGKQALDIAQKEDIDLILMDVRMPVMDGYQATREIRKLPGYKDKKIIALTADISDKVKEEVETGLFNDIIMKPVDPDDLKKKIIQYTIGEKSLTKEIINNKKESSSKKTTRSLNLDKVYNILKDNPEGISMLLEKTLSELEMIQKRYPEAIIKKDKKALDDLEHKYKWTMDLFELGALHDHMKKSIALIKSNPSQMTLNEIKQEGINIIRGIKMMFKDKIRELE